MSENIYDILAKLPKDVATIPKESEPIYESVDPNFELNEAVNRLTEKFDRYKVDDDEAKYLNPQAKRFVQLAKAKFPETSSDLEAVVASIGDKTEELDQRDRDTAEWISKAKATIGQQQREIEQTEQAVIDANARYDAQEKRFQDFNRQVAAANLDVQQQAQAALDYAQQPGVEPQAVISKVQAQQPAAEPKVAEPAAVPTTPPVAKAPPVQQEPEQPAPPPADNVIDFDSEKKKREPKQGKNLEKKIASVASLPKAPKLNWESKNIQKNTISEDKVKDAAVNTARQNWEILSNARLNPTASTDLVFGDKVLPLKPLDVQAIYTYLLLKSTRNIGKKDQHVDSEFLKNLIKSNLNSHITVLYLLGTNELNNIRTTLKRMDTKLQKAKQVPIDYNATAQKPAQKPVQQPQQTQQQGLASTQFGKYIQQKVTEPPQQGDLFGNPTMSENINKLATSLMERFMNFKEAAKPDFLDLDKDGDTEEPMKSAAKSVKDDEPAKPDSDAVAKRKRLQALKDKQEDERAEKDDYDSKSSSRVVKGRAYGGAAQKDDEDKEDLDEKAVSKAQQKFMGMVHAVQKGKMKAPSKDVAKTAKGMTKKAAKDFAATKHKGLPQHVAESRNAESSEYTYETVGRVLCDEQPGLDCNSEAFVKAVYDELIEMKLTPKAARWLVHYDEDFLSDCATSYDHFCASKEKEMAECGAPMNSFVSEEPVVDAVQELDEIARLAGLPTKTCESCDCNPCKCESTMGAIAGGVAGAALGKTPQAAMAGANIGDTLTNEEELNEAATRKDFRAVAELLKNIEDVAKRTELALHHADIFKQQNPRFKREMFLAAAGVDTTPIEQDEVVVDEAEMGEGNEFSGALAAAKASGAKEFEVDGKKYTVKEDINLNVSATGEEDVVNLIRKLSGMPVVAIQAQPAVAEEVVGEAEVTERDIEHTNTPREVVAGTDAAIPAGADLNRAKKQFKKEYPGDNPMAVAEAKEEQLWKSYEAMINDVKA